MIPSGKLIVHIRHVLRVFEHVPLGELRLEMSVPWREIEVVRWTLMTLGIGGEGATRRRRLNRVLMVDLLLHRPLLDVVGKFGR